EFLSARGAIELEQVGKVVVDRLEAEGGVCEHRKERNDPGASENRGLLWQIDQQQWRNGDDRGDLKDHRIRIQRIFEQARLIEQDRQSDTANDREQQPLKGGDERDEQGRQQDLSIGEQGLQHEARCRQHVGRDRVDPNRQLPDQYAQRECREWQYQLQQPLTAIAVAPAVAERGHDASPLARRSASDTARQYPPYSAEVRKRSSRG